MAHRINRAIELLEQGQAIYYDGEHSGHVLTHEQGRHDAGTWADYINVGMEHGAFDMTGLESYMRGMVDGGPTRSGHRTPAVIVEAPVNGTDEANVRFNAWQFRQILGRGAHGILLCQAETADGCGRSWRLAGIRTISAVSTLGCRRRRLGWMAGSGLGRGRGAWGSVPAGVGRKPRCSVWGVSAEDYMDRCDPWPLNPRGELLLGVKLESPEGIANADAICAVPGLGFAEMGPGDLSLSLGSVKLLRDPYPPVMQAARDKVFAACRRNGIAFLEGCTPGNIVERLDEGVRVSPAIARRWRESGERTRGGRWRSSRPRLNATRRPSSAQGRSRGVNKSKACVSLHAYTTRESARGNVIPPPCLRPMSVVAVASLFSPSSHAHRTADLVDRVSPKVSPTFWRRVCRRSQTWCGCLPKFSHRQLPVQRAGTQAQ